MPGLTDAPHLFSISLSVVVRVAIVQIRVPSVLGFIGFSSGRPEIVARVLIFPPFILY